MHKKHLTKANIHSWLKNNKQKTLSKLGIEGNFLNLVNGIYEKIYS